MSSLYKWLFRIGFILLWSLGIFFAGRNAAKKADFTQVVTRIDTLFVRDTITQDKPVYITTTQVRTEYVPVLDTLRIRDTLFVPVTIEKRVYEDSLYRAEVSGYSPSLDKIEIYQQKQVVTQFVQVPEVKRKRWGIGVQAGYGINANGSHSPYIGIGLSYNLICW